MKAAQAEKKQRLENSAFRLFLKKGINETSVNDIVKDASLAKGTFYVYYKDKSQLVHEIGVKINTSLMHTLILTTKKEHEQSGIPWACAFLKHLIQYFQDNPPLLKLLHHLFLQEDKIPLPLIRMEHEIACFDEFIGSFQKEAENREDAYKRFLLVMEISAVVCYNAVFYHQPDSLEHITEMFYNLITHSFFHGQGGIA